MPKNQPINRSLSPPTLKTTKIFEPLEKTREKQIKSRQRTNTTTHTVLEGNFYVSQYVGAYKKAQNYHYNPPQKKSSQICQICQQKNQPNAGTPLIHPACYNDTAHISSQLSTSKYENDKVPNNNRTSDHNNKPLNHSTVHHPP